MTTPNVQPIPHAGPSAHAPVERPARRTTANNVGSHYAPASHFLVAHRDGPHRGEWVNEVVHCARVDSREAELRASGRYVSVL